MLNPPFGGGADDRGATPPEIASPVATVEPEPDPVDENGALTGVEGGGPARLGIGLDEGGASISDSSIASLEGGKRPALARRPIGGGRAGGSPVPATRWSLRYCYWEAARSRRV